MSSLYAANNSYINSTKSILLLFSTFLCHEFKYALIYSLFENIKLVRFTIYTTQMLVETIAPVSDIYEYLDVLGAGYLPQSFGIL